MHQQPARHIPCKYRALRTRKRGPENRTKKNKRDDQEQSRQEFMIKDGKNQRRSSPKE
jgi:hypothetical protein